MTNNPTIDGVSPHPYGYIQNPMREDFEQWAAEESEVRGVGETIGLSTDEHHDRYSMIWTQTSWIAWQASQAAQQSTIARLEARITQLESEAEFATATYQAARDRIVELERGKGEAVLIQAVAVTRDDEDEGLRLEWLLEGGISELEFSGTVLFAMPEANDLCDESGSADIYTAPPAPAAVFLPLRRELPPVNAGLMRKWSEGWNDCLDATAALNNKPSTEVKP